MSARGGALCCQCLFCSSRLLYSSSRCRRRHHQRRSAVAVVRHHGDVGGGMGRGKADIAAGNISIFRFLMSFRVTTLSFVRSFVCCLLFRSIYSNAGPVAAPIGRPQPNARPTATPMHRNCARACVCVCAPHAMAAPTARHMRPRPPEHLDAHELRHPAGPPQPAAYRSCAAGSQHCN